MYSIKLVHGHALSFGDRIERHKTAFCQLLWQGEGDEKPEHVTDSRSIIWTPKTAKRADEWARRQGRELMADYGAYLRKHGERKEVVERRKRREEEAERKRVNAIKWRCGNQWQEIIKVLREVDPGLVNYLETGQIEKATT